MLRAGPAPAPAGPAGGALEAKNQELPKRTKLLAQENAILRRATAYLALDVLTE